MIKKIIPLSLLLLLILYGCNQVKKQSLQTEIAQSGMEETGLPDFPLYDMQGNTLNLKDFKGKTVFINLWASWCGPCREEMPSIQKLYEKTKGDNVQFVLLSLDEDFGKSLSYFNKAGFTLPMFRPAIQLPSPFNVDAIPASFVFNSKGELTRRVTGTTDYDTEEFIRLFSE